MYFLIERLQNLGSTSDAAARRCILGAKQLLRLYCQTHQGESGSIIAQTLIIEKTAKHINKGEEGQWSPGPPQSNVASHC